MSSDEGVQASLTRLRNLLNRLPQVLDRLPRVLDRLRELLPSIRQGKRDHDAMKAKLQTMQGREQELATLLAEREAFQKRIRELEQALQAQVNDDLPPGKKRIRKFP